MPFPSMARLLSALPSPATPLSATPQAEAERKAREDRELEGVTFTPAITKKAWELKQRERDSIAGGLSLSGLSMDGSAAAATGEEEKWLRLHVRGVRKSTLVRSGA